QLAAQGVRPDRGLVYPVVYSDGKHFAPEAKATQYRKDLTAFTYPYEGFKESAAYFDFHTAMMAIAQEIETHLDQVPAWQPNWPIVELPAIDGPAKIALAKL